METDIFLAGVRPGGPGTEDQVKVLLCHTLSELGEEMDFDQLYDALSEHELVNYFELVRALEHLTETGHLSAQSASQGQSLYRTTDLGKQAAKVLETSLPLTVRERALGGCRQVLARARRLQAVRVAQTPGQAGGFILELAIPEGGEEMLALRVFLPTEEECAKLRRRFLNAPHTVYKGVMALLTGNEQVMGKIFSPKENLF